MIRKRHSSNLNFWMQQYLKDKYVRQRKKERLRSRAWFKLAEIQKSDKLFKPDVKVVVDLGSTPGGWSQFVVTKIGKTGRVIACDLLPMDLIDNVEFLQGNICDRDFCNKLKLKVSFGKKGNFNNNQSHNDNNYKAQVVISDIAPNICGIPEIDIPNIIFLMEKALELCSEILEVGGSFLVKAFQGNGFEEYLKNISLLFKKIKIRKPNSSKTHSREVYIVATGFKEKIPRLKTNNFEF